MGKKTPDRDRDQPTDRLDLLSRGKLCFKPRFRNLEPHALPRALLHHYAPCTMQLQVCKREAELKKAFRNDVDDPTLSCFVLSSPALFFSYRYSMHTRRTYGAPGLCMLSVCPWGASMAQGPTPHPRPGRLSSCRYAGSLLFPPILYHPPLSLAKRTLLLGCLFLVGAPWGSYNTRAMYCTRARHRQQTTDNTDRQ